MTLLSEHSAVLRQFLYRETGPEDVSALGRQAAQHATRGEHDQALACYRQALLLDEDCEFDAKPELEIYADDVKCSHGSTTGAIDETALFYLRSRGVPLRQAQSLLVLAFLAEAIAEIDDEAIAEDIRMRLEGWLARHDH